MKYATTFSSSSSLLLSSSLSSLLWLLSGSFLMLYIRVQSSQFFSHKNPLEKWLMLKIVSHEIYGFLWNCVNSKIFKEEIVFNDQSKPEMRVLKGRWIFSNDYIWFLDTWSFLQKSYNGKSVLTAQLNFFFAKCRYNDRYPTLNTNL